MEATLRNDILAKIYITHIDVVAKYLKPLNCMIILGYDNIGFLKILNVYTCKIFPYHRKI